jgi:MFS family permease
MLSRTISGFCSGNLSVAQAYITDISTKENRTKAMGMIGAAFGMGFILGPPIGGYLNSHFGFWSLGAFSGGLCALNAIIMYFLLPESITIFNKDKKINLLPFKEFVKVFETPFFGRIFIISFIFVTGFFLFQIPSPLLWKEHFHLRIFSSNTIGKNRRVCITSINRKYILLRNIIICWLFVIILDYRHSFQIIFLNREIAIFLFRVKGKVSLLNGGCKSDDI